MKTPWFTTKKYGWGWVPATWQGWTVVFLYAIFLVWDFLRIDRTSHSNSDTIRPFIIHSAAAAVVLVAICIKTGEKPRWRWGGKS